MKIIMFKPLTKDNIGNIIKLLMEDLNKRLADRELKVELTKAAEDYITEKGYDPVYGARPLKRFLQKYVETLAAKLILADKVREGDTILIDLTDGELTASAKTGDRLKWFKPDIIRNAVAAYIVRRAEK